MSNDISASDVTFDVTDGAKLVKDGYIIIDNESLLVETITGNNIIVKRGQDGTGAVSHVAGAGIGTITAADNVLIEFGDDFGFDGSIS